MLERHSWKLFMVIGGMGLVMSVAMLVDPGIGLNALVGAGPPIPEGLRTDPFAAFFVRWTATALIGANGLTLLIAPTAFRRGERWAGIAFCYWPLMFLSHLAMYRWGPMSVVQLMWISLSLPAVVAQLLRSTSRRAGAHAPAIS